MDPIREEYWRRRLSTVRFGAEPIEIQLAQRRNVTIALSVIMVVIGLMFLTIFRSFGRLDLGLKIFAPAFGLLMSWAWLDYARLRHRVRLYLLEKAVPMDVDAPPS